MIVETQTHEEEACCFFEEYYLIHYEYQWPPRGTNMFSKRIIYMFSMKIETYRWLRRAQKKKHPLARVLVGWWFQPIWKNISQIGNLLQIEVKIKEKLKPPPR